MNTLIPLPYYSLVYYYFLLVVVLFVYAQSNKSRIDDTQNLVAKHSFGIFLLFAVIAYMGTRPVSGFYFGDMRTYANAYLDYASGGQILETKDIYFEYFMKFCSSIMSVEVFFLLCAFLYIFPLYVAMKRLADEYWFYGFVMLIISFSFWPYGTNGIRNGIATSFFILAITRTNITYVVLWLFLAAQFHKSLYIPLIAYVISRFRPNTSLYLRLWVVAIPLSLILGGFWESFFLNLGLFDSDRLDGYLGGDGEFNEEFSRLGFRWDFLLYSATGVFAGWYFVIKKRFEDVLYTNIFNVYLLANTFWILVIRASFSNRFAYLSWFLLGIVIIYPLLKNEFVENQHKLVGRIILIYFLFTFVLNVILV